MTKRAVDLLIGDIIIETEMVKTKKRVFRHKVTGVKPAACSVYKTHVIVDGNRGWCYDSAYEVEVQ